MARRRVLVHELTERCAALEVQEAVYSDPQLDTMLREHRAAQGVAQRAFEERLDAREKPAE